MPETILKVEKPFKSVLYLSYDGLSDAIGQSQVLPYLRACHARGIPLHLVTFEKAQKAEKIAQIEKLLADERIHWHRLSFTEKSGLQHKIYDFGRFIRKAFSVARQADIDVIHGRSYFASMVGLLLKNTTGKKLIFDKRDFWIDAVVETGRLDLRKKAHRLVHDRLRAFERALFRKSDHVVSLTHKAKEIVLEKYPQQKKETVTVVPCCADLSLFDPQKIKPSDQEALRKKYGLEGATVFGYVGSVGPAYMIGELFSLFKVISGKIPAAKLLFMVNNDPEEVLRLAESAGISRDQIVVTHAPREQMPLHISIIDYGLFFIMPTFAKQACSPTKQYEMLAMGKPIITNKGVGDAEKVFEELDCGFLLEDFSEESYRAAADWISQNPPKETRYDLSHYSLEYGAEKYYTVYRSLLDGKS